MASCPQCQQKLRAWMLNQGQFDCPYCQTALLSNANKINRQAYVLGFFVWALVLLLGRYFSGSWGYALIISIEAGIILAIMLAMLYRYLFTWVKEKPN